MRMTDERKRASWRQNDRKPDWRADRQTKGQAVSGASFHRHRASVSLGLVLVGVFGASFWLMVRVSAGHVVVSSGLAMLAFMALTVPLLTFLTPVTRLLPVWKKLQAVLASGLVSGVPRQEAHRLKNIVVIATAVLAVLVVVAFLAVDYCLLHAAQLSAGDVCALVGLGLVIAALLFGLNAFLERKLARLASSTRPRSS